MQNATALHRPASLSFLFFVQMGRNAATIQDSGMMKPTCAADVQQRLSHRQLFSNVNSERQSSRQGRACTHTVGCQASAVRTAVSLGRPMADTAGGSSSHCTAQHAVPSMQACQGSVLCCTLVCSPLVGAGVMLTGRQG